MKTSIATVSISGELPEKLAAISTAGFDAVEIFENDFLAFDGSPADVGRMVRDHGLDISLFQPFRDFEGMPPSHRQRTFDRAERKFDVMQELGTDLLLVCSNVSTLALGGIDRAADDFRELGERAQRRGLRVGYEALAWGKHINDHRDAWEIVRRANHPSIGLILDSFHSLARRIDINSIRSIPRDRIFLVQLADAPKIDMDPLYWSRHFRNMPGEGDLPIVEFTAAIVDTGYDSYFSLEIFNDQFRGGPSRSIAADGHRSLVYLGDRVRRLTGTNTLQLPSIPDRIAVNGVAFVEFTADEADALELGALLTTLGFARLSEHRSKRVTLYQQGEIRILINTEASGYAHQAFEAHGTSAYAVALRVGNASDAMRRAVALGAESFRQPGAPDELEIPAIRGIGGSLVYLVEDGNPQHFQQVDFEPASLDFADMPRPAGLTGIDHVAQTVPYDQMPTWLLFYSSIFDVDKTPVVDIVDPSGVVRSQVIENASGALRITMNGAENTATLAGHFLAEKLGPAVQHIAFASNDIFASARALQANGFRSLAISPNYHDDVEARFGLDPGFTDQLRAHNILYDRDEHGEYLQLYSTTFGEGFFFEIVERRGYKGYGAANAIFRIAALKKGIRRS